MMVDLAHQLPEQPIPFMPNAQKEIAGGLYSIITHNYYTCFDFWEYSKLITHHYRYNVFRALS
jgi:hypothetical protein